MRDGLKRTTGELRQRSQSNYSVYNLHGALAKTAAGCADNAAGAIARMQVRHQRTAGLLWETVDDMFNQSGQTVPLPYVLSDVPGG